MSSSIQSKVGSPNPQPEYIATNFSKGMNSRITPSLLDNEECSYLLNMDWDESLVLKPRYGLKLSPVRELAWDNLFVWSDLPSNPIDPLSSYGIVTTRLVGSEQGLIYNINPATGGTTFIGGAGGSVNARTAFTAHFDWVIATNPTWTNGVYVFDRLNPGTGFVAKRCATKYDRTIDDNSGSVTDLTGIKYSVSAFTRFLFTSVSYPNVVFLNSWNHVGNDGISSLDKYHTSSSNSDLIDWIEVGYQDGDYITGLYGSRTDAIVFKNSNIYQLASANLDNVDLYGDTAAELLSVKRISGQIGCISGYAICEWNGHIIFPSRTGIYALSRGGGFHSPVAGSFNTFQGNVMAEMDGWSLTKLSDSIRDLTRTSTSGMVPSDYVTATIFRDKYILSFPEISNFVSANTNTRCYALDLNNMRWTEYDGPYVARAYTTSPVMPFAGVQYASNSVDAQEQLIVASHDGLIYTMDRDMKGDGDEDDPTAFTKAVRTKAFNMDDFFSLKLFDLIKVHMQVFEDVTLTFRIILDEDTSQSCEFTVSTDTEVTDIIDQAGATWDDFDWNDANWNTGHYEVNSITGLVSGSLYLDIIEKLDNVLMGKRGRSIMVEISSSGVNDHYELHQLALEVQNLGRSNMPKFYTPSNLE